MDTHKQSLSWEEAQELLGVPADAGEEQVRAAYLEQVRLHPPDRDPEAFERIRDAYEQLRDPIVRARRIMQGPDPTAPLHELIDDIPAPRRFVGPRLWLDTLKELREKRS